MSCSTCNCNPCQCNCSCDPENEALSSAFATFSLDFIGTIEKACVNGEVVWTLPCDLGSDEPVSGIPKLTDESIFCYFLRCLQIIAAESGVTFPITIAQGGTEAITAAEARINLGLEIGVDVQAWDPQLDSWATKSAPSGTVVGTTDTQTLTNKTFTNAGNTRQTLTDAATIAWNADLGSCAVVALGANRAMGLPTNLKVGTYILETTGAFAITSWDAIFKWASGTAPVGGGTRNAYTFYYNGTDLIGTSVTSIS